MPGHGYTVEELMLNDSFVGYCNGEETHRQFWEKEIALHADQLHVFEEAKHTIQLLTGRLPYDEIDQQVEKIRQMVTVPAGTDQRTSHYFELQDVVFREKSNTRKTFLKPILIAASIILVLFGSWKMLRSNIPPTAIPTTFPQLSFSSTTDQRKKIVLPDSSIVILNAGSSIQLEEGFNLRDRKIKLLGEAFFDVKKNAEKPLIVSSGNFSTTALGTAFYVSARDNSQSYRVRLLEGKVELKGSLKKQTASLLLMPGESGAWTNGKEVFDKTLFDTKALNNWLSGRLIFEKMPASAVVKKISEWYGVEIKLLNKKMGGVRLSGDYNNQSLEDVLKVVCFSLSADYVHSGNQVIIK